MIPVLPFGLVRRQVGYGFLLALVWGVKPDDPARLLRAVRHDFPESASSAP